MNVKDENLEEFIRSIQYVEDRDGILKDLIKECYTLNKELKEDLINGEFENEGEMGVRIQKHPTYRRMDNILEYLNNAPSLVYYKGEVCRIGAYSVDLPIVVKSNVPFSERRDKILSVFGLKLYRVLGVSNEDTLLPDLVTQDKRLSVSGGVVNILLGAMILNMNGNKDSHQHVIGKTRGAYEPASRWGDSYTYGSVLKYRDLDTENTSMWVSYIGDSDTNLITPKVLESERLQNYGWELPQRGGYTLPIDLMNLEENLMTAQSGGLYGGNEDNKIFTGMLGISEVDNMKVYSHKLTEIMREDISIEEEKRRIYMGNRNVKKMTVPVIHDETRWKAKLYSDVGVGLLTHTVRREDLLGKYVKGTEETKSKIEEILKDSILTLRTPKSLGEVYYYNESKGVFESSSHGGTYQNGLKIEDILGIKRNLGVSSNGNIKLTNVHWIENETAEFVEKLEDGGVAKYETLPVKTVYVYTRHLKGEEKIPIVLTPNKEGDGVVNHVIPAIGRVKGDNSLYKYVLDGEGMKVLSARLDIKRRYTPRTAVFSSGDVLEDYSPNRGWLMNYSVTNIPSITPREILGMFPIRQGIYGVLDRKLINGSDISTRGSRYLIEGKITDKDFKYVGKELKPAVRTRGENYSDESGVRLVEPELLNEEGIMNASIMIENGARMYKVFQDKDISESKVLENNH